MPEPYRQDQTASRLTLPPQPATYFHRLLHAYLADAARAVSCSSSTPNEPCARARARARDSPPTSVCPRRLLGLTLQLTHTIHDWGSGREAEVAWPPARCYTVKLRG
jgi:hypothetical protein